jgi:phosphatidylglycerophosphatase C
MAQDQPADATKAPCDDRPIVAFDFDGTLTVRDSFTAFLKWRAGGPGYFLGFIRLIPAALAYLFDRDRGRIKAAAVRVYLRGVPRERLEADAREFAGLFAAGLLRPDALAAWEQWRREAACLVIVTASPELTVAPFAQTLGADLMLGTRLAFDGQDRVAGAFEGLNCRGPEKVVRLKAAFGPDVRLKAAYGDTGGDREMLAMAETTGYRVFKETP